MRRKPSRRDFIRTVTATGLAINTASWLGCGDDAEERFSEGVASGDPREESVILWTRLKEKENVDASVDFVVATDADLDDVIAAGTAEALASSDHTVRVRVAGLQPYTKYYYRFRHGKSVSPIGRTKTAPAPDQDVSVQFAFASCQDFAGRYFHSWRALLEEETTPDFVVFLGDYIYEYESGSNVLFEEPPEERRLVLPDGFDVPGSFNATRAAGTLADYRALYRYARADENLREAHRLFPFICMWDDHEFANDCWQDVANDFNGARGEERDTERRSVATRAWFEYLPIDVDYRQSEGFPGDIEIYRSFRFGKHVELALTDQRYFRSDHVVPEGPADPEVGKATENSVRGSRTLLIKEPYEEREIAAAPTMLGEVQKQWLIDGIQGSPATWKLCGSAGMMMRMLVDLRDEEEIPSSFRKQYYFKADHWDGFLSERAEILSAVQSTENVVVLSGDIHAFFAAELYADFDDTSGEPAAVEFTVSSISSDSLMGQVDKIITADPLTNAVLGPVVPKFNDITVASNPHATHVDTLRYGIALATITADDMTVDFLAIDDVQSPEYPGVSARTRFRVVSGSKRIERG